MNFAEVLLNPATALPIKRSADQPFRKHLGELLEKFMEIVESSVEFSKLKRSSENPTELSKSDLRMPIDGIYSTVDQYFKGNPVPGASMQHRPKVRRTSTRSDTIGQF